MSTSVNLPQLGESVTEGTITRWLIEVGEHVEADEPLVEVSTDKVDTEIPSPVSGTLLSIAAPEDEVVEVGGLLAEIGDSSEAPASPAQAAPTAPTAQATPQAPAASSPPAAAESTTPAPAPPPAAPAPVDAGTQVTLPELGESVTEGTVTRWLKEVGEAVEVDDPLVEISTDKVDTEIPSPVAGVLQSIAVPEDEIVEVGGLLAVVSSSASPAPAVAPVTQTPAPPAPAAPAAPASVEAPAAQPPAVSAPPAAPPVPSTPAPTPASDAGPAYVTPLVRKLASEKGIDLNSLKGTGVGGRIRRQDVVSAAEAAEQQKAKPPSSAPAPALQRPESSSGAPTPTRGRTEKMTRLRRVIATRMVESLQVSAQLTTVVEVDVTRIALLRTRVKDRFLEKEGVKLSFLPFFAKAVVESLKLYPVVNCSIDTEEGTVTYPDAEHLGVAVDTDRGLLVPVIRDSGDLNIAGLSRRIADLASRTRTNKVTPDELSGGTFTLTNTGSRGALFDTPIINQPQVAILGTGAVVKRPVVVQGPDGGDVIAVRSMVYLALTYDHRIVDGADAARFLASVKQRLEAGEFEGEVGI